MTKSHMYRLAGNFGTESSRSFAVLKKIGDVAAVLFLPAYAAETKAILSLDWRRHACGGGRALTFLH
jgi:hypothetical protein